MHGVVNFGADANVCTFLQPAERATTEQRPQTTQGPNGLKLAIFAANANGGPTLTRVPERWQAEWPDIVAVGRLADRAGMGFCLAITPGTASAGRRMRASDRSRP